ncbi:MAG: hypothetical protein QOD30_6 [Actinomycetota bacterium]|jgi:hypothetical protein|nr:hypothetical protein [Actinomycetota bacterium]
MRNDHIAAGPVGPGCTTPVPLVRVLVEDAVIARAAADLEIPAGFSVTVCSGPFSAAEPCPLVTDSACPHGVPDVVVSNLTGPWAHSVRAAWKDADVPVAESGGDGTAQQRLDHAMGAAISAFFPDSES